MLGDSRGRNATANRRTFQGRFRGRPPAPGEAALPSAPAHGKWSARPTSRAAPAARGWHGGSWVNTSSAILDYEEFSPPGAIRLAIPGPVRAVAGLRRDGGAPLERQHQRGLSAPEDPLLQRELS